MKRYHINVDPKVEHVHVHVDPTTPGFASEISGIENGREHTGSLASGAAVERIRVDDLLVHDCSEEQGAASDKSWLLSGSETSSSESEPECLGARSCKLPFRPDMIETGSRIAISANVTSLRQQYDEVLRLPWDLACLPEVFDMRDRLAEDACDVVFGTPQEALKNPWHCAQGGVAIVARNGMTLQKAQPVNQTERKLLDTRRFVHAVVALGSGKQVMHVIPLYGYRL